MDFLLDDETVEKMNEEYSKVLPGAVGTLCVGDDLNARYADAEGENDCTGTPCPRAKYISLLFLYIASRLRYNTKYGTQIYDSHGSVGRLRPVASAFGSVNNLGTNAR